MHGPINKNTISVQLPDIFLFIYSACVQVAEKSRGNRATEKEIQVLAKGLEEQHTSHARMDHSRLAGNRPGNDEVGGAMDRLLHQQSTDTSTGAGTTGLTAATTMTSGAMETTSDLETPGISGKYEVFAKI